MDNQKTLSNFKRGSSLANKQTMSSSNMHVLHNQVSLRNKYASVPSEVDAELQRGKQELRQAMELNQQLYLDKQMLQEKESQNEK